MTHQIWFVCERFFFRGGATLVLYPARDVAPLDVRVRWKAGGDLRTEVSPQLSADYLSHTVVGRGPTRTRRAQCVK